MAMEVTLRRAGGSVSVTIPSDLARRFQLQPGDRLQAIATAEGILFTPFDADLQDVLTIAAEEARRFRPALRELAQ